MNLVWGIVAVVVLLALIAVSRVLRLFLLAFALAACGLLLFYWQDNPAEATAALAAMGAGIGFAGPARRLFVRTVF